MSSRAQILKGSSILSLGQGVSYACSFLRNVLLFRLISKADFGIAATFGLAISLIDLSSKLSISRLIVQSKKGDKPDFLANAHFVQAIIGMSSAVALFAFSGVLAEAFNIPETRSAFRLLALIPFLKGFYHLDVNRMTRRMHFLPSVTTDVIPQIVITLIAWPMAIWLNDYRVLLWLMLIKWTASLIGTHLVAELPYRWGWNRNYFRQILAFGLPLLINSFLMLAIGQGNQYIIGTSYSMEELAIYFIAASVSDAPSCIILNVLNPIMLPLLARNQDSLDIFRKRYTMCVQWFSLCSVLFAVVMIIAGEHILLLIYGPRALGVGLYVGWLCAAQGLRILREGSTLAAMAKGDTRNIVYANVARLSGFLFAFMVVRLRLNLSLIAVSALLGELISLAVSMLMLSKRHQIGIQNSMRALIFTGVMMLLASATVVFGCKERGWIFTFPLAFLIMSLSIVVGLFMFPSFKNECMELMDHLRRKMPSWIKEKREKE